MNSCILYYTLYFFVIIVALFFIHRKYHYTFMAATASQEGFDGFSLPSNCPTLLIKRNDKYYLYNTTKIEVPGVNPIVFDSLDEYGEFMEWLRNQGIRCPVLYLQSTNDAQGNMSYRMLATPHQPNLGLPTERVDKLFDAGHDAGSMPSFDPHNQYIGLYTPLDQMEHTGDAISANPMDTNWGGPDYTQQLVDAGVYKDSEVKIRV